MKIVPVTICNPKYHSYVKRFSVALFSVVFTVTQYVTDSCVFIQSF